MTVAFECKLYNYEVESGEARKVTISDDVVNADCSIYALKISKNGKKTAVGYDDGSIVILNANNDFALSLYNLNDNIINEEDGLDDIVYARVLCWTGQHICCGTSSGHIIIYNTRYFKLKTYLIILKI